jgi:hypothetical protein
LPHAVSEITQRKKKKRKKESGQKEAFGAFLLLGKKNPPSE